ncbi:MAG TPA: arginase [Flavobacteriales bacterium]|nr:arginase [Flavobacteriales bacterium]
MKKAKLVLLRSELGAGTRGASMGVDALKIAAIDLKSDYFRKYDEVEISDENWLLLENVKFKYAKRIRGIMKIYERLSKSVGRIMKKQAAYPIVLSGDHSTAGGTIAGIKSAYPEERLGVIWIDAHADLHSPYTTPSGNMHGMPLAAALGEDNLEMKTNELDEKTVELWDKLKNSGGIVPKIEYRDLVYIGVRDTEEQEDFLIEKHHVKNVSTKELRTKGVETIVHDVFQHLNHCDRIYVSFDVDSLDPRISVGTGTPVPNGLRVKEAKDLMTQLVSNPKVCCFEIVEINPTLDTENSMAETAFKILEAATNAALSNED